jgi:hypothetical protein
MLKRILITALLICAMSAVYSKVPQHTADSIANLLNQKKIICDKTCPLFESENSNAGIVNTIFIDLLSIIGTIWLYNNYKKKYFIVIGTVVVIVVTGSLLYKDTNTKCIEYSKSSCLIVSPGKKTPVVTDGLSDFQQIDSTTADSQISSTTDEFTKMDISSQTPRVKAMSLTDSKIIDPVIAFILIGVIAFCMRYKLFIRFRGLILFIGVVWLGFYRGGCTCMIASFQNLILGIAEWNFVWTNLIWLGVLILATFLFGRVWCGWLCHLGGIQEFLFRSPRLKILTSVNSQKYLRITRYVILGIWTLQLLVTQKNIFCEYDPFKTLFNYIFTNWISLILLFLVLFSSVIIYRPFCRILCPIGVILGWISKIPGARRMRVNSNCVKCGLCTRECAMCAIDKKIDKPIVHTEECIVCGECNVECRKDGIKLGIK